jgi:hypothetical protein
MLKSHLLSLSVDKLFLSLFIMSSRMPSALVRRFDYRVSEPILYSRDQWEALVELAELNHWNPFPLPGLEFYGSASEIYSPGLPIPKIVDFDDFVLDLFLQTTQWSSLDTSLIFLSDDVLLSDHVARQSIVVAFWSITPSPALTPAILCFSILITDLPGDLQYESQVVPIRLNTSSFRFVFPAQDPPASGAALYGYSHVNRFIVRGEPMPVP